MDKNEIKDVIKEYRAKDIKENSIWRDPRKAKDYGETGWIVVIFLLAALIVVAWGFGEIKDNYKNDDFEKLLLKNIDCQSLKQTLLELEDFDYIYYGTRDKIHSQLLARC